MTRRWSPALVKIMCFTPPISATETVGSRIAGGTIQSCGAAPTVSALKSSTLS